MSFFAALQSARARLGGGHDTLEDADGAAVETPRWGVSRWGVSRRGVSDAEGAAPSDAAPPRLYAHPNQDEAVLADINERHITATALLARVTGLTRTQILARPETPLSAEQAAAFEALVARAALGEPLAYLTGQREFYGLEFDVDPRVLVPRPETERLVDLAMAARPRRVLDVGTGSGCIAVSLAVHLPEAAITATDVSPEALAVARHNAQRHGVAGRIHFIISDLLRAFQPSAARHDRWEGPAVAPVETPRWGVSRWGVSRWGVSRWGVSKWGMSGAEDAARPDAAPPRLYVPGNLGGAGFVSSTSLPTAQFAPPFDLIAANLPYIDRDVLPCLPVARFEPRLALDGGPGGLALVERLLAQAPGLLAAEGHLLLEIGVDQGPAALNLAQAAFPGSDVRIEHDLAGLDRVLVIGPR